MRRVLSAGVAALLLAGLAGCTGAPVPEATPDDERAITSEEAQRLAVVRFRNYDAGARSIRAEYAADGHDVSLDGWFDYASHTGFAVVSADGRPSDAVAWDAQTVAIDPVPPTSTHPAAPPTSVEGWGAGPLDPQGSELETVLAVLAGLGADRPENPLLLEQSDARRLREDEIDGTEVTVFSGPTTTGENPTPDPQGAGLRYWVDATGLALRVEARLGEEWATIDLGDAEGIEIAALPGADGTR